MKIFNRLTYKKIKNTFSRYLSIIILVTLGVSCFIGISSTELDMKKTLLDYSFKNNLFDIRIKNNFGIDDKDKELFDELNNIKYIEHCKYTDKKTTNKNNNIVHNSRIWEIPKNISKIELVYGKFPSNDGEVVVNNFNSQKYKINDIIEFKNGDYYKELKVVGYVNSPEIISLNSFGFSETGIGKIDTILYTTQSFFVKDFLTVTKLVLDKNFSNIDIPEYKNVISSEVENIKKKIEEEKLSDKKKERLLKSFNLEENKEKFSLDNDVKIKIDTNFFVETREDVPGFYEYLDNASRLKVLAYIFSSFLLFISSLVASTTISRMIDEERSNIGLLKSLGYEPTKIKISYLIYSLSSSFIGFILGIILGTYFLPQIIYTSSYSVYSLFKDVSIFYNKNGIILIFFVVITFIGILPSIINLNKTLNENIVDLIRPKIIQTKKHIFLEKLPFLWNKLSFNMKVTFRNIFRYKKRSLMLISGISGCVALIITGIGIKDSLTTSLNTQLKEFYKYDIFTVYNENSSKEDLDDYLFNIKEDNRIKRSINIINKNLEIKTNNCDKKNVNIIAFDQNEDINDFFNIKVNNNSLHFVPTDGIIISEKLSKICNIKVNDLITVKVSNKETNLKVKGINKWFIGHQIFTSTSYYNREIQPQKNNGYLLNLKDVKDCQSIMNIINTKKSNIFVTSLLDALKISEESIKGLDFVILIMLIFALVLALVVLFNLINITLIERIREIATLKVLGLHNKEIVIYIFREFTILTFVGILIGCFIGTILEKFIITKITSDQIMFFEGIYLSNYLISSLTTAALLIFVLFVIINKNKKINMLESLKSIE